MNNRSRYNINVNSNDEENEYLTKILIFTDDPIEIAEKLKAKSNVTVSTNCLNTIGMYPLIERVTTPLGQIAISIWIINSNEKFAPFRLGYYSGASHSLIINNNNNLENVQFLSSIAPTGVPKTILNVVNNTIPEEQRDGIEIFLDQSEENRETIIYQNISSILQLRKFFIEIGNRLVEEIISGQYRPFSSHYSKTAVFKLIDNLSFEKTQELVGKLGYELDSEGKVIIHKNKFSFEIDFFRNQVAAIITECLFCEERCKHYRPLCVVEYDQGYSSIINFDNLRALAILYSLHENDFFRLTGGTQREDIQNQLNKIESLYKINCRFFKEKLSDQNLTTMKKPSKKR